MDQAYTREYEQFEQRHWWFVARREIIFDAIDGALAGVAKARWLDVGCGTGVLLSAYDRVPADRKVGLEMDGQSVSLARSRGLDVRQVDAASGWDLAPLGPFNLVTACDVIEHVEHDRPAVDAMHAALAPGGHALVTVPALMGLWSGHDVVNHHYRRYTRPSLLALFPPDRWDVVKATYFSSLLLPMVWAARKVNNLRGGTPQHDLSFGPAWRDRALLAIFRAERPWVRWTSFPLGSSLLVLARRRA